MWKNDNFFIGALTALLLSAATALLILFVGPFVYGLFSEDPASNKLILLAAFPAVFLMRYYMKQLRFEKAGMGAVVIIFVQIVLYFIFIEGKLFSIYP